MQCGGPEGFLAGLYSHCGTLGRGGWDRRAAHLPHPRMQREEGAGTKLVGPVQNKTAGPSFTKQKYCERFMKSFFLSSAVSQCVMVFFSLLFSVLLGKENIKTKLLVHILPFVFIWYSASFKGK